MAAGLVTYGIDTRRNVIDIGYAALATTPEQQARLTAIRDQSPVSIDLHALHTTSLCGTLD